MRKGFIFTLALIFMVASLAGCGGASGKNKEITLAKGQFSEPTIIAYMNGILIEKNTDLKVNYNDPLATIPMTKALKSKEIDIGMGYDGTLLTTILGYDPSDVPEGEKLFEYVKKLGKKEQGLTLTEKFGFENTYALAVRKEFAEKNNIETISDLKPYTKDLVFGAEHEFFAEEGTIRFNPLNEYFGFEWGESHSIDIGLKFSAMDNKNIDVTVVYSTDGLNKKSNLAILKDNKDFFPQYYGSQMIRDTLFEEYADAAPNLEEVLLMLEGQISNEEMIEMNYQADAKGEDPQDIARNFLKEKGLIE